MLIPMNEKERNKLVLALKSLRNNEAFAIFMNHIKNEIHRLDVLNRNKGFENQTSEVKGFSDLFEYVAACQAPETDRDKQAESDAERESAQPVM